MNNATHVVSGNYTIESCSGLSYVSHMSHITHKTRGFEKISFEQYYKDINGERSILAEEYLDIKLPQRATKKSAGYDFFSPKDFELKPKKTIKIPTGIKVYMQDDEMLDIRIRSSLGFKYDVTLSNSAPVIDADYHNNIDNEGHIWIKLINHGDKALNIEKGEAFVQGIFFEYLIADDDKPRKKERVGGIGSTN